MARSLPYNPALDGLRALSVVAILCFHSDFAWAKGGFLGVSAFFTLSGFLITRLLLRDVSGDRGLALGSFFGRRFRRLMPAGLVGIALALVYALFTSPPSVSAITAGDVVAALFYVTNWRLIARGDDYEATFIDPSPVQQYWSLAIEEQFYLLHPLLLLLLVGGLAWRRTSVALAFGGLSLASAALMAWLFTPGESIGRVYYGSDTRAAELFIGATLALALPDAAAWRHHPAARVTTWAGPLAALGLLAMWGLTDLTTPALYRGGFLFHGVLTAVLIAAVSRPGPLHALLALRPLVAIGRISYGLYIYHWLVFLWLDAERTGLPPLALFALRTTLTFLAALASYRLLEQPIRAGERLTGRAALALAATSSVVIAGVALGVLSPRADVDGASEPDDSHIEYTVDGSDPAGRILVIGDSVGRNLGRALASWGRETRRARVKVRATPRCGVVARPGWPDYCVENAQRWRSELSTFEPHVVLVISGGLDMMDRMVAGSTDPRPLGNPAVDARLVAAYVELADEVSASGARIVFASWPCMDAGRQPGRDDPHPAFDNRRIAYFNQNILPAVVSKRPDRTSMLPLFDHVCPDGRFAHELGPFTDARGDGVHFEGRVARWVAEWMGPRIVADVR